MKSMLVIKQPYTYKTADNKVRLEALITEDNKADHRVWYEVSEEYGSSLCYELADAFLIALIPVATAKEQDIRMECKVSPKLLYRALHTLVPFYARFLNRKEISVSAGSTEQILFGGEAVITGCSLGVDSLSAIYHHLDPDCPPDYRLSHLALFNSGQIGNAEQEQLNESFVLACEKSAKFAGETGLPLLTVNSNLVSLLEDTGLTVTQYFHFFTISCVLAVQKMVKTYIMASSYSAENMCLGHYDVSYSEAAIVPLLGNENTEIVLADPFMTRVEKTRYICKNPLTPGYLDVCWADSCGHTKGGRTYYLEGKSHRNCGWCEKCMRTLLTLELLDAMDAYAEAFDLKKYRQYRKDYIVRVVAEAKYNAFYREMVQLMQEKGMRIPFAAYLARLVNVKDSKIILWLWQSYNRLKRKRLSKHGG